MKISSNLSISVLGESTSLPIDVTKMIVQQTDPIPFLDKCSVYLELHLMNNTVPRDDISAKLKLLLPMGASIKKFELRRDYTWYPATAVPKQKAKAVVYKEKEKGRAVAAVTNLGSTNSFEMEISPIPYQKITLCRLEIITDTTCVQELIRSIIQDYSDDNGGQESNTEVVMEKITYNKENFNLSPPPSGGAVVGKSFRNTHFVCKIPPIKTTEARKQAIDRVAILWDSSASMRKSPIESRCSQLQELFNESGTSIIEFYTFGMGFSKQIGEFSTIEELFQAIHEVEYDGGSDMVSLSNTISELIQRKNRIDSVLIFTDGVDNLDRKPVFDSMNIPFPIHCIADTKEINLSCVKTIAAASMNHIGTVFTEKNSSYLSGILYPQPVLCSIKVNQDEDAFMQEIDDGFRCIPDHRLRVINQPIMNHGMFISGILGDSSVTSLRAKVALGEETYDFVFQLCEQKSQDESTTMRESKDTENIIHKPTLFLKDTSCQVSRILGHIYAEERYLEAESFGLKSGLSTKAVREELATSYGFCSPDSTLLMLYEKDQFLEHGILPPVDHPISKFLSNSGNLVLDTNKKYCTGEIGGLKSDNQRVKVLNLASQLKEFFTKRHSEFSMVKRRDTYHQFAGAMSGGSRAVDLCGSASPDCFEGNSDSSEECEEEECDMGGAFFGEDEDDEDDCDNASEAGGLVHRRVFGNRRDDCEAEIDEEARPTPRTGGGLGYEGGLVQRFCSFREWGANTITPGTSATTESISSPSIYSSTSSPTRQDSQIKYNSPSKNSNGFMELLATSFQHQNNKTNWKQHYHAQLECMGGHDSVSPSFFLNSARVLIQFGQTMDAIQIATNCLEIGVDDVQMLRSVGYILLSTESSFGVELAIQVFEKVKELAPLEPQSFIDISFVKFFKAQKYVASFSNKKEDDALDATLVDLIYSQKGLVHVLTHCWAHRFDEIEWPALVLLHYVADLVREIKKISNTSKVQCMEWPPDLSIIGEESTLRCIEFDPVVMIWLGWDTDKTDIDLHVVEPSNFEVYYGNRIGNGSRLSRDFTEGYGPEVYIARHGVADYGSYKVYAKYYAHHQASKLTGATSAVVWSIVRSYSLTNRSQRKQQVKFSFVRLDTEKNKMQVDKLVVGSEIVGCKGMGKFGLKNPEWYPCVVKEENKDGTLKVQWDDGKKVTSKLPMEKFCLSLDNNKE